MKMNARNMPHLRRGIRKLDRVQRLSEKRALEQAAPEEMRHRVAQKNLRARQLGVLQMPSELFAPGEPSRSGKKDPVGLRGSHPTEGGQTPFTVRPLERTVRVRPAPEILPHFTTRRIGERPAKMFRPRLSGLAIVLGILLATSAHPTIAAAPEPDVRKIMGEYLDELKTQWKANEHAYIEEQSRIHALAEKAREALCSVGELRTCKHAIQVSVTSYNPMEAQTDASPCHGAGGNVCDAYNNGKRPIALSQDLIATLGGGPYRMGDTVEMQGGNCTGTFTVMDTMNARWTNKADIFFPDRSQNVGCVGVFLVKR